MGLFDVIAGIFKPAADLVDSVHTSAEEKLLLRNELVKIENNFASKVLDYESKLVEQQASIVRAEAEGASWLQRNWRPLLMAIFGTIVANNYILYPYLQAIFGFGVMVDLPPDMWDLLKIGVGGYIVSRGTEKSIKNWKK